VRVYAGLRAGAATRPARCVPSVRASHSRTMRRVARGLWRECGERVRWPGGGRGRQRLPARGRGAARGDVGGGGAAGGQPRPRRGATLGPNPLVIRRAAGRVTSGRPAARRWCPPSRRRRRGTTRPSSRACACSPSRSCTLTSSHRPLVQAPHTCAPSTAASSCASPAYDPFAMTRENQAL
jgi:hypothetical protein